MYQYFPVADVNTSALEPEDLTNLSYMEEDGFLLVVADYDHGWLFAIQSEPQEFEEMINNAVENEMSSKFIDLMRSLRAYGFQYVRVDTEGLTDSVQRPPMSPTEFMEVDKIKKMGN